jgi:ferrous iron transport protein B
LSLLPNLPGSCCAGCSQVPKAGATFRVALVGQPNCGKSTLFNAVAGYRSATGNFSGTTVHLTWSRVRVNGAQIELIDVPGIYSLTASSPTEIAAKDFLLNGDADVIVNVVDASLLGRSLELTLELRELGVPMVVCLNMMDEARHKGMAISSEKLSDLLRFPVVETVASRGTGVPELFTRVVARHGDPQGSPAAEIGPTHLHANAAENHACAHAGASCAESSQPLHPAKLLESAPSLHSIAPEPLAETRASAAALIDAAPPGSAILQDRHARAAALAEQSVTQGPPQADLRIAVDNLLTHPVWGYVFLLLLLGGFFWAVFGIGGWLEKELLAAMAAAFAPVAASVGHQTLAFAVLRSLWDGFVGGAAIVLPYLIPFLFGLALLEDIGYLPRVAYLLDGLFHRIGLHGTSVVPIMLGYGCSVPACLATRVLPSRRDRFLASVLSTLVPCSARSTVIFALAAFYLGPVWALGIFAFNAVVVFASGWLLTRLWPEMSAGMILEVPRYQWPSLRMTSRKVWLRLREFIVVSWPLLVIGSGVLGFAEFLHWDHYINTGLSPLTMLLGLPVVVGVTLVFGILRKELSMIMLVQALGTTNVHAAMTTAQILTFTIFVTSYIPCLATLVAMTKEIGRKFTTLAAAYSFALATFLGVATRLLFTALRVA